MSEFENSDLKNHGITSLNQLITTPSKDIAQSMAEGIRSGEADPAMAIIFLKKMKKVADSFFDSKSNKDFRDVKDILEEEILKYKEGSAKTFKVLGATITEASSGGWVFKDTEDAYLQSLYEIQGTVKELIKNREEALKLQVAEHEAKNKPKDIMDFGIKPFVVSWNEIAKLTFEEGYGETVTKPPVKLSKSTLRFKV